MEIEKMTLGSPTGSPSSYLPPFLMGESVVPTTPRSNTLSPAKGTRANLAFAQSPPNFQNSPDFNKSNYQQRFLGFQSPPQHSFTSPAGVNKSISGPPTQGLFDSLRAEKNTLNTPTRGFQNPNQSIQQMPGTPTPTMMNQSYQYNQSFNDSYLNQSGFNASRITSPLDIRSNSTVFNASACISPPQQHYTDFWITIYGFPMSATPMIIANFSQCGTIVDKVLPSQNGNWIHLKYSSRLECDRALNYNEKILGNNLMIGVTRCKDPTITDKENIETNETAVNRVRPLVHMGYKIAKNPTEVVPTITTPKKSTGIVNKAMDLFFGW